MQGRYIKVEYDPMFTGGNYFNVGQFALLDASECQQFGVQLTFEQKTGYDPVHIVHYCENQLYDHKGQPVGE